MLYSAGIAWSSEKEMINVFSMKFPSESIWKPIITFYEMAGNIEKYKIYKFDYNFVPASVVCSSTDHVAMIGGYQTCTTGGGTLKK
jgi:hypothetical protein